MAEVQETPGFAVVLLPPPGSSPITPASYSPVRSPSAASDHADSPSPPPPISPVNLVTGMYRSLPPHSEGSISHHPQGFPF
ncbi:hypothetical protein AVEN_158270-1 [Araneus ventricosus]|uniref:Uncharacterized protein n=1 Tax=Araneus ventricosus TaxID=182803 RepID=A0A4Y2S406_ARAVE|nr:hypothetical protein AVEN_158270-1 [Araneus ventricosus]